MRELVAALRSQPRVLAQASAVVAGLYLVLLAFHVLGE